MAAGYGHGLKALANDTLDIAALASFWVRARPGTASYELRQESHWTQTDHLIADVVDRLQVLTHLQAKAHGGKPPKIQLMDRPGGKSKKKEKSFGGSKIPLAELDAIMAMNGWSLNKTGSVDTEGETDGS